MITLYRPSNYDAFRAPSFAGRSSDIKPEPIENGAIYRELDTGNIYCFDAENKIWYDAPYSYMEERAW